jgi:hypothetical protein
VDYPQPILEVYTGTSEEEIDNILDNLVESLIFDIAQRGLEQERIRWLYRLRFLAENHPAPVVC